MSAHCSQQVAAVQLTPTQLSITQFSPGLHLALQSDIHIKGVCVTKVSVRSRAAYVELNNYIIFTGENVLNIPTKVRTWGQIENTGVMDVWCHTYRIRWRSGMASRSLSMSFREQFFSQVKRLSRDPLIWLNSMWWVWYCAIGYIFLLYSGSFPCDSPVVAVHNENLYTVEPNRVQIRTPQVCYSWKLLHTIWVNLAMLQLVPFWEWQP